VRKRLACRRLSMAVTGTMEATLRQMANEPWH
jgi:hypothetical protein